MNKLMTALVSVIATLLVVAVAAVALLPGLPKFGREEIVTKDLGAAFESIGELAVEEYVYSNVGSYDNKGLELRGIEVPFTGRNFLITYDGSVKAGIRNVEKIDVDVDDALKQGTAMEDYATTIVWK